jgi:hypothetical protein
MSRLIDRCTLTFQVCAEPIFTSGAKPFRLLPRLIWTLIGNTGFGSKSGM